MSNEEFVEFMEHEISRRDYTNFEPIATYNEHGDCIEVILEKGDFFGQRLDDQFTVYISYTTKEIVGFLLKGVNSILTKIARLECEFPGIKRDIINKRFRMNNLIEFRMWSEQEIDDDVGITYKDLSNRFADISIPEELCH